MKFEKERKPSVAMYNECFNQEWYSKGSCMYSNGMGPMHTCTLSVLSFLRLERFCWFGRIKRRPFQHMF